jgi:PAS domain S-box-containing protein
MDSRVLLAICTVCAAGAMALGVARRARRSDLHALLLALLGALALWACGVGLFLGVDDTELRELAVGLAFFGVVTALPLWLLVALRAARPRQLERWRSLPLWIALPYGIECLAMITNSGHHLMLRQGGRVTGGFFDYAGPLLYVFTVISLLWLVSAAGILLHWGAELWRKGELHRASLVALGVAALLPIGGLLARMFVVANSVHAVMPASFVVALLLLTAGPLRDRLLRGVALSHRDVFDSLRDGVLVANARGAIVDANPAAERLLGCSRSLLRERQLAELIAEIAVSERSSALRRDLEELASSPTPLRLEVGLRDGRRLEVRAASVGGSEAEPVGRYALLRDRSEERRFAEVARRAQKLETIATLAGGVAHEVSNPLAFVRANLAEIERSGAAAQRWREKGESRLADELADLRGLAQEALEGIARIERIAAGMRRLSTAGEGFTRVELGPVIDEAVQLARIRFARPLAVELDLPPELPPVHGAPALLVQALLHLLVAVQRGTPPGAIRLKSERVDGHLVVRIQASRAGEAVQPAESDDPGLPIACDIARDHGGEIEVRGPVGAPFELALRLPLAESA